MTEARALLLTTAFRHRLEATNIEEGFAGFVALTEHAIDYSAFCSAIATCLREGLIHEPIRLPDGALQCHWHLELTARGVNEARRSLTP